MSFLRTMPDRKPRTECSCQPVDRIIAAIVAPVGACNIAMTPACLEVASLFRGAAEGAMSGWIVSAVVLTLTAALIAAGRKLAWFALVPALGLPLGFVIDTSWWLWRFGHELDPSAPIDFPVFTPVLVGPGTIGQFHTWAWPAVGFWVALAGLFAVVGAEVFRRRVCRDCPLAGTCGTSCPRWMVVRAPERR